MWPPKYTVRNSKKAKQVLLHIDKIKGLEIVIPHRQKINIENLLEEKRNWIKKYSSIIALAEKAKQEQQKLPDTIHLKALNETWQIQLSQDIKRIHENNAKTILCPENKDILVIKRHLYNWLKKYTYNFFHKELETIARKTGLKFNTLRINNAKTRWGSCSCGHNITLNIKLIFLPFSFMEYVMLHELCHTIHLDHSDKFWSLVGSYMPDYKNRRRALRNSIEQDHIF